MGTLGLVSVLLTVFAIDVIYGANLAHELAVWSDDASLVGVLTAPLVHFSAAHLDVNTAGLLLAGWYVEAVHGGLTLVGLLVAGGFAGSVVGLFARQSASTLAVGDGASPMAFAIVALLGAALLALRRRD